jgi:hypothetical protein
MLADIQGEEHRPGAYFWKMPVDDPWRELMRAVVANAAMQARRGMIEAIVWLRHPDTLDTYVLAAGVDTREVTRFANEAEARVIRREAKALLREVKRRKVGKWKAHGKQD